MSLLREISRDLGDLVARAAPAVAGLRHGQGQGSGVVVSPDGYVVTNSHVARAKGPLHVRLPGRGDVVGRLVGADDRTDLVLSAPAEISLDVLRGAERRVVAIRPGPAAQAA